ncbi:MAG: glycosyltransferase family 2 protein [Planctomycetes bacterium]|nr:glycosyltransferase family 2 protein [Planctomycetota bacterium]
MRPQLLSVVVPAYNERESVERLVTEVEAALRPLGPFELVVVDDGSTDGTREVLQELAKGHPELRVIALDRHHGQTCGTAAGIAQARGDVLVTIDADLQNPPSEIPKLLAELDRADAVVGYRQKRNDSGVRKFSSRFANAIRNRITRETIRDTGCSLKAFRTAQIREVALFEGMHRFLPTLLKMHGRSVVEVAVDHRPRVAGTSKYGVWNRVFKALLDCLAVRWMQWRVLRFTARDVTPPRAR